MGKAMTFPSSVDSRARARFRLCARDERSSEFGKARIHHVGENRSLVMLAPGARRVAAHLYGWLRARVVCHLQFLQQARPLRAMYVPIVPRTLDPRARH